MDLFDANAAATNAGAGILDGNRTAAGVIDNTATTWSVFNLDISALTDSAADLADLEQLHRRRRHGHQGDDGRGHDLGAIKSRIGLQQDFVKSLMDAIDRGVGSSSMPT